MALLATTCGTCYASAYNEAPRNETAIEDVLFNEALGYCDEIRWEKSKTVLETPTYTVHFGDITDTVEVLYAKDGCYTVKCIEGDKENILSKTAKGEIFLNGKKVEFSIDNDNMPEHFSSERIAPLATETWFQKTCPYGNPSDYSHRLTSYDYSVAAVHFNMMLKDLTTYTFCAVMASSIASWTAIAAINGTEFATGFIFNELVNINAYSTAVSYTARVYTHRNYTSGFITPIITRVWKYKYTYHAEANYNGNSSSNEEYKCQI